MYYTVCFMSEVCIVLLSTICNIMYSTEFFKYEGCTELYSAIMYCKVYFICDVRFIPLSAL